MDVNTVKQALRQCAHNDHAAVSRRFFKTGAGEYGEGDVFIGVKVPDIRKLARRFKSLAMADVQSLLRSPIHEERHLALCMLCLRYERGDTTEQNRIARLYLRHTAYVNNWDLVDVSAPHILGPYFFPSGRQKLFQMAESRSLWERRIAVMTTYYFIRQGDFDDFLKLAAMLLDDREDLIHKAVGWMLREVGKRDLQAEERFLKRHYCQMPRTMLRYAIEKFPLKKRKAYLQGKL